MQGVRHSSKRGARSLVMVVALAILLAGLAPSPSASASGTSRSCCFRLTIDLLGAISAVYQETSLPNRNGVYRYEWQGTAYGLGSLWGSGSTGGWISKGGVAGGYTREENALTQSPEAGQYPGCPPGAVLTKDSGFSFVAEPSGFPGFSPASSLSERVEFSFGPPWDNWGHPVCDATEVLANANPVHPAGIFIGDGILRGGIFISNLREGRSEHRTCIERAMTHFGETPKWAGYYYYKVYANVVYFPAKELRSQERRLKAFRGKKIPEHNPANSGVPKLSPSEFNNGPPSGCS